MSDLPVEEGEVQDIQFDNQSLGQLKRLIITNFVYE